MTMLTRRAILPMLICAPAIVRAASLMPVRSYYIGLEETRHSLFRYCSHVIEGIGYNDIVWPCTEEQLRIQSAIPFPTMATLTPKRVSTGGLWTTD